MQDFDKFLNELIDNKFMAMEAKNLGLDKEADFIMNMDNYALNLFLARLRQDEISNKIKVEDKEIENYYQEQLKKKEEEKKKAQEKIDKEKVEEEKTDAAKKEPQKISARDKEAIRKGLVNEKSRAREKEYFAAIREKAKVKIDNEALSALFPDKNELFGKVVAQVNGESIYGIDVLSNVNVSKAKDEEVKKEALDKLILYKILDQEVMSRGYGDEEDIKIKIKEYREQQLIDQFKRKAVLPAIKVEEKNILAYYDANKERYKESDRVRLKMIQVVDKEEARVIYDDLKKGADFSYLAREKSIDPSREGGGDIGWVSINQLLGDIKKAVEEAKEGALLGPFPLGTGYVIVEFRGIEKGAYIPLDKVRSEIDKEIGTERFNAALNGYIKRLRETVPVEINRKELDKMQGR
ncbi:MAG TPA: peptidyl-prolyl cis-trans isomerase [Thermodesulfobacteriota bacterium]|nr:peptidyl-prolyl cis-trans isomerase [Thermodesulfobacteriota bacterium]